MELREVSGEVEGEMLRSFLVAQGIEAVLRTGLPPAVYPGLTPVKVLVRQRQLEAARRALNETELP